MNEKLLIERMEKDVEQGHLYIRWLVLIAAGAFSLTVNVFLSNIATKEPHVSIKIALISNALAILFGGICASGEAKLARGIKQNLIDIKILEIKGDITGSQKIPRSYALPAYMLWLERLFYASLISSICAWIYFILQL